jgi:hypothetical protein
MRYAALAFANEVFANQIDIFGLWYQRRAYERSRGEMITMLYEKSLSRKVISISGKPLDDNKVMNGNGTLEATDQSRLSMLTGYLRRCFRRKPAKSKEELAAEKAKDMASTGKIMNLMRFVKLLNHSIVLIFNQRRCL